MKFDIAMFTYGAWMRRRAWKPDKIVYLRPADEELMSFLVMKTDHGSAPYLPARCDLLENDWEIDWDRTVIAADPDPGPIEKILTRPEHMEFLLNANNPA